MRHTKVLFSFLLLFAMSMTSTFAQTASNTKVTQPSPDQNVNYRLFQTNNRWTFLKLDTRNGKITHVQYSTDGKSMEYSLNPYSLLDEGEQEKAGRFFLYPTENTFNFLLLDQVSGKVYQVQWNIDEENRGIWRIY